MTNQSESCCPLCKENTPVLKSGEGGWRFSEHVASDTPGLCEFSGMVAIGTPKTHFSDMVT